MPIYEYRCRECRARTSILIIDLASPPEIRCQACGGTDLMRLISRVGWVRSEEARRESLADLAALGGLDESDPASVARWAKRMGEALGEDVGDIGDIEDAVSGAAEAAAPEAAGAED